MYKNIAFIGGGRMGEALIKGVLAGGIFDSDNILVSDTGPERLDFLREKYRVKTFSDNRKVASEADIIILAVKPQVMDSILEEVGDILGKNKLVVSIAAGITIEGISKFLPNDGGTIVRVMPNTPAMIGEGMSAIAVSEGVEEENIATVMDIFGAVGKAVLVEERMMDAVTGLSGSGPAFIYTVIESLADAGVKMGLAGDVSTLLATQTVKGAAEMVLKGDKDVKELRAMVTSPGGTTIAGLQALEEGGIRDVLISAVETATKRSKALGEGKK